MAGPSKELESQMKFMTLALQEATKAQSLGEVPVGAVVTYQGQVVGRGYNLKEKENVASYHAEILALEEASRNLGRWRLIGCDLYVTLEPCPMCAGAMIQSRIDRLFFGATDPKGGAVVSLYELLDDPRWNHQVKVTGGLMQPECSQVLKQFFAAKRRESK